MAQGNDTQTSYNDAEKQDIMAFLRERYLYLLSNLCSNNSSTITMYDNTLVQCQVKAFDLNFENIVVENLRTALPTPIPKAVVRTNDIISMQFDCDLSKLIKF